MTTLLNGSGFVTTAKYASGGNVVRPAPSDYLYKPYLDEDSGGEDAGLGVYDIQGSCNGNSDDNEKNQS